MNFTDFIDSSPTCFHAVKNISSILEIHGFKKLSENEKWNVQTGGRYYVTRNSSSVIAFSVGDERKFNIIASHSDSPCLKIKPVSTLNSDVYERLNTEIYGAFNFSTWLDRPLCVAGRVVINNNGTPEEKLIFSDKNCCIIPSLAIHLDRDLNNGFKLDKQKDMLPVYSICGNNTFIEDIAISSGCNSEDILATELFVVSHEKASVWGRNNELISSPRLDDLMCAFSSLEALINANPSGINVFCCFDNEEVGSGTKQGALSTFLSDILERICICLGVSREEYLIMLDNSFMLSADNAHAVHPAHPEKTDRENKCILNGGIVIKYNSNQKYMSDAVSIAKVVSLCKSAGIPYQLFANNSNIPGGSTLGNLSTSQVSVKGADVGAAQLAMHSSYETAGTEDIKYLTRLFSAFYGE